MFRKGEHLLGLAQQTDPLAAGRGRVVLVEGAVDAIAVDAAGHIGLAAGGTRLTPAHADQLRQATAGRGGRLLLLLAYDGDPAGQAATNRAADLLPGLPAEVVMLPDGCDPADLLTAHGPRGLRRALAQTRPLLDVALVYRLQRWERHTGNPVALVEAVHEIAPLILTAPPEHLLYPPSVWRNQDCHGRGTSPKPVADPAARSMWWSRNWGGGHVPVPGGWSHSRGRQPYWVKCAGRRDERYS